MSLISLFCARRMNISLQRLTVKVDGRTTAVASSLILNLCDFPAVTAAWPPFLFSPVAPSLHTDSAAGGPFFPRGADG